MTGGGFFGETEGALYSLTFSLSGIVTGTSRIQDSSHNSDAGIICKGEPILCKHPKLAMLYLGGGDAAES